ncbi:MAG: alkaline phosphatase family protein [Sphingobacteriales bacterium 50-39]|nr:alkaline phosphatase family protein [Sphingobacteriales bacterium]OJW59466.1 MAG: alkaline phosphatase family protein [Sphingobacteriales bacterium 50-39]
MRNIFILIILLGAATILRAQTPSDQLVTSGRTNAPEQQKKPYVIFISADGFRWDLADKYHATNLLTLRSGGVAAERMTPSYPSVTFPNHYSLATGLYPSHHGLVDNSFYDPKRGRGYRISDRTAVQDSSWYGGTPIWNLAEEQHMLSASFFWVGSEAAVNGMHPTYYYIFNDKIPLDSRLKTVKDWLQMPEEQRPHLILFYLSQVDHAEHIYGPDSKEAEEAVLLVDDCIGRMTRMVDSLHLPVNYIFVADHGMASIDTVKGGLEMPRSIDTTKFLVSGSETLRHLYAKDKKDIPAQYEALKKENPEGFDIYLPDETPARRHYTSNDDRYGRMGDILLVTKYPRMIYTRNHKVLPGEHGFDNALPQMGASFYAWGPAFKRGLRIAPFENVNVYPLIAKILGLTVPEGLDGKVEVLEGVLK